MSGVHWTAEPNGCLEPKVRSHGFAARKPITLVDLFREAKDKFRNHNALALKRPVNGVIPSEWKFWTWEGYYNECRQVAKSLIHLGLKPFDIVNILGFNSPEWVMANNGSILAGCIAAGIYSTNSAEACHYITQHSKAKVVVLEDNKQLAKYASMAPGSLPDLKAIVIWVEKPDEKHKSKLSIPVYTWEEFIGLSSGVTDAQADDAVAHVKPGHCATLIYTSGTTGPPKSVMISHDNLTWTSANVVYNFFPADNALTTDDKLVSFLPLSHIAAQILDIHVFFHFGGCVYFCQPDALKGSLTTTMRDARPTVFFGVPRVWEKIQEKMVQMGRANSGIKLYLAQWAKAVGAEKSRLTQYGNGGGLPFGYGCANTLILSKIKEALGLNKCRAAFTSAAPISEDTLNYFASLDIPVYEVFGQSENTGPHSISINWAWKIGYCGRPMPGCLSKVDPSNNELLFGGRHVFMGYMYMPDKTAEAFDEEGFLRTGDVGEFDGNDTPENGSNSGFLRITGRIKEILITAGGENIPPVLLENEMKSAMVALSNVVAIGDKKKFLTMLVSLKVEVDLDTGIPTNKLAADALFVGQQIGSAAKTVEEAAADPLWKKYIDEGMKKANAKTTSSAQIIQKWCMLPVELSEKAGDLTPTLKLKRNVVHQKYASLIDSMYEGSD